ncbi:hypothetical protein ASPZODRAFT_69380 [Penicilliopsis zonata CBS 506.65]|uniref:Fe2OG dioxygenase domain-containing protein n=1 Tax=Penicilliopsis zonata CBS 506.65 TaxID=1073090 RepID=A0A1L9SDK0_9EURO|nr:hypothetical protein ASPZODRAFT_69380 [Penicilliopsis zonata CBS 506.65]OJJ45249.1 hypothetical protein ASPZODRAFT_69380 [Penicilliopsis zonata CBS 506.65]
MSFLSIPVLDYSLAQEPTKTHFLASLRHAIVNVGFFYLKNTPISPHVQARFVALGQALFDLPIERKLAVEMVHSRHFLGYSRLGAEITNLTQDFREQFDFGTELPPPSPDAPLYHNIKGPNQWPDESDIPGFRVALEEYLAEVSLLGDNFKRLIAEALDLPPTALDGFFDDPQQYKLKLIKYPPPESADSSPSHGSSDVQGVGPHKDSDFMTFLLQATPHTGLEVQNKAGQWISAPPIPDTLVVNIGRALEALTRGVCTATTHRVSLRPENFVDAQGNPLGPRFSFPVFQGICLDLSSDSLALKIPTHIADLVKDEKVKSDAEATFNSVFRGNIGQGTLIARITSHQDVGARWYPDLLAEALKGQKQQKQ